jgi:hypothetical protein
VGSSWTACSITRAKRWLPAPAANKAEQVLDALGGQLGLQRVARENAGRRPDHPSGQRPSSNAYYQRSVETEVFVEEGDAAARNTAFDSIIA